MEKVDTTGWRRAHIVSDVEQAAQREKDAEFEVWWPTLGPAKAPRGRHLQYKAKGRAGISDRMTVFNILMALGEYHGAVVHVLGMSRPEWLLTALHSPKAISKSWDHYFDTKADGGMFWHEIENFTGCRRVDNQSPNVDLRTLFEDGSLCVELVSNIFVYEQWQEWSGGGSGVVRVKYSQDVLEAAQDALARYALPKVFGTVHIRRCDRMMENSQCTQVNVIRETVASYANISTWLVFMYAEPAYPQHLREVLQPLERQIFYEDQMVLNPQRDGDNYFQFLVALEIQGRAEVRVETHFCKHQPQPYRVFRDPRLELLGQEDGTAEHGANMCQLWTR